MQLKKMSSAMIAVLMAVVSLLNFSCDKQPIGPDGPDPLPPPAPGTYLPFTDFRALYTGTDITVPAGTKKIRGVVISNSANVAAGNYRLQDESGAGIYLYSAAGSPIYSMGAVLEIDAAGGQLISYQGDLELKGVLQQKVKPLSGTITVTPRVAAIDSIIYHKDDWASSLVTINNVKSIVQYSSNSTGVTYDVTDSTGRVSMFIRAVSGISVNTSAHSVTGYVSIYNGTTQIGIRTAADIQ